MKENEEILEQNKELPKEESIVEIELSGRTYEENKKFVKSALK